MTDATFQFTLLGALISAGSAVGAEIIRIRQASERLAADMQQRELTGGDPLAGRVVRFPRWYFLSAGLYAVIAGAAGGAAGPSVPWLVYIYIGFSLPTFISRVLQFTEPLVPGRVTVGSGTGKVDHPTLDSVSQVEPSQPYRRVQSGVFRAATSVYSYLSA